MESLEPFIDQREIIWSLVWAGSGLVGAMLASSKGRGGCLWFSILSSLGPFAILVALFVPGAPKK